MTSEVYEPRECKKYPPAEQYETAHLFGHRLAKEIQGYEFDHIRCYWTTLTFQWNKPNDSLDRRKILTVDSDKQEVTMMLKEWWYVAPWATFEEWARQVAVLRLPLECGRSEEQKLACSYSCHKPTRLSGVPDDVSTRLKKAAEGNRLGEQLFWEYKSRTSTVCEDCW